MPKSGFLTPSSFADLMTNGRGTDTMGKSALAVVDRLTLDLLGFEAPEPSGTPRSCAWGNENEPLARLLYTERTFREVRPTEFTVCDTHPYVGGTMDGLVGLSGGVEIKCPYSPTEHLANILTRKQVAQYTPQMQGYMWIYVLDWIDFISYDPRLPEPYDLVIERIERDDAYIERLKKRCEEAFDLALINAQEAGRRCGVEAVGI